MCLAVSLSYGAARAALAVSGNGGESWSTVQAQGLPAGKVFTGLACPTASVCWVSGNTPLHLADGKVTVGDTAGAVVLSSANGGRTWLSAGLPKGIHRHRSSLVPQPEHMLCVGIQDALNTLVWGTRGASDVCTVGLHRVTA